MPKVKGLTQKQAKFVQGIAEGKPAYKAAYDAYDTKSLVIANNIAVENRQKPSIKAAIEKAMAGHEITAEIAVKPVADALRYQGDTKRETLEMQLKGTDRYLKLLAMTEDKQGTGGNTFIFNQDKTGKSKYIDQG